MLWLIKILKYVRHEAFPNSLNTQKQRITAKLKNRIRRREDCWVQKKVISRKQSRPPTLVTGWYWEKCFVRITSYAGWWAIRINWEKPKSWWNAKKGDRRRKIFDSIQAHDAIFIIYICKILLFNGTYFFNDHYTKPITVNCSFEWWIGCKKEGDVNQTS